MAFGPGKYNDVCTEVRIKTGAAGVLVLIFDGHKGSGFSAQLPLELQLTLPTILRSVADQIDQKGPAA